MTIATNVLNHMKTSYTVAGRTAKTSTDLNEQIMESMYRSSINDVKKIFGKLVDLNTVTDERFMEVWPVVVDFENSVIARLDGYAEAALIRIMSELTEVVESELVNA